MKSEEEIVEQLIAEKNFDQLTLTQKELVLRILGSEEEYTMMRRIESTLENSHKESEITPDHEILNALKISLRANRRKRSVLQTIVQWRIPAYATVMLAIVTGLVVWLSVSPEREGMNVSSSSSTLRIDTVFITKTDTVFAEKFVYRQLVKAATSSAKKDIQLIKTLPAATVSEGVSMKEKEELNRLLVSGSE